METGVHLALLANAQDPRKVRVQPKMGGTDRRNGATCAAWQTRFELSRLGTLRSFLSGELTRKLRFQLLE